MKRLLAVTATGVLAAAGVATSGGMKAPVVRAATTATCTPGTWVQEAIPVEASEVNGDLYGVTIVSATDAWAVGYYYVNPSGNPLGSLWEHWDGTRWTQVTNGGSGITLNAVTNFGPNDVIAVGTKQNSAIISHWNGSTIRRDAISGGKFGVLNAVSGSSASDVWAEGTTLHSGGVQSMLLYHYNGTTWTRETGLSGDLMGQGIVDHSPSDVEVLAYDNATGNMNIYKYNGHTWSIAQTRVPLNPFGDKFGLVGQSDSDLYGIDRSGAEVDHWNGSAWSLVGPPFNDGNVYGLAEGPPGTIWADGNAGSGRVYVTKNGVRQTNPPSIMEQPNRLLITIAAASGLVIAVSTDNFGSTPNLPIALISCD